MSFSFDYAGATAAKRNRVSAHPGDDRVGCRKMGSFALFYLADGATGVGLGGLAADAFVDAMEDVEYRDVCRPRDCASCLQEVDEDVRIKTRGDGDTTGILVVSDGRKLWGASAGDSMAWLFGQTTTEITGHQRKKPRIGSGATPVAFGGFVAPGDTVVLGSDGLWSFLPLEVIERVVRSPGSARDSVAALETLVRQRSNGALEDDFSAIVIRF